MIGKVKNIWGIVASEKIESSKEYVRLEPGRSLRAVA